MKNKAHLNSVINAVNLGVVSLLGLSLLLLVMHPITDKYSDNFYPNGEKVGEYDRFSERITMTSYGQAGWELQMIATHEICHVVWFKEFTGEERDSYQSIVDSGEEPYTEYSKKDVREDFAEHCERWVYGQGLPIKRFKFLNEHLKGKLDRRGNKC